MFKTSNALDLFVKMIFMLSALFAYNLVPADDKILQENIEKISLQNQNCGPLETNIRSKGGDIEDLWEKSRVKQWFLYGDDLKEFYDDLIKNGHIDQIKKIVAENKRKKTRTFVDALATNINGLANTIINYKLIEHRMFADKINDQDLEYALKIIEDFCYLVHIEYNCELRLLSFYNSKNELLKKGAERLLKEKHGYDWRGFLINALR